MFVIFTKHGFMHLSNIINQEPTAVLDFITGSDILSRVDLGVTLTPAFVARLVNFPAG